MRATGWLRRNRIEVAWGAFALANLVAMFVWPHWMRLPFYLIWLSLVLVYGFRLWSTAATTIVVFGVSAAVTGVLFMDGMDHDELAGSLIAIPFLAAMFATMVWHAQRRTAALGEVEAMAERGAAMLDQQRRFLEDVSHELRTPVTIARGHLELLRREGSASPSSMSRSTSSPGSSGSSRGCCFSPRPSIRISSVSRNSSSTASSRTCSCAGRRSRREPGGWTSTLRA